MESELESEPSYSHTACETIEIFESLPGKAGCSPELLDDIERHFGGALPPLYRWLMESDANRMVSILKLVHPSQLIEQRTDSDRLLADDQDDYTFRLESNHVVITIGELGMGFNYFEANGDDSTPVFYFDTEDDSKDVRPRIESRTFVDYIALKIRERLQLP